MRSLCVTTREYSLLATTREGPHAATETHCSHEQMKKKLKKKKRIKYTLERALEPSALGPAPTSEI